MGKSTRFWIILLFAVAAACIAGFFAALYAGGGPAARNACIYLDGELYREIDLNAVALPYVLEIETQYGTNTVRIAHGEIAVTAADCPDQVCVRQGAISDGLVPIVCLPHRLVIEIEEGTS